MDFSLDYTLYYQKEHERRAGVSKPRSGRPKMLNEAEKVRLLDAVHKNPRITREDLLATVSHKVETPSIQPLLNAENLWKWRCSWRPYLTEEHAFKRRQWAFCYQHFTPEDWARVFFCPMTVRWSVESVSVENGHLLGQKTSQNSDKFKAFHNGESRLSRCFGLLSRALPVELI